MKSQSFNCSELFSFRRANHASCQWLDNQRCRIFQAISNYTSLNYSGLHAYNTIFKANSLLVVNETIAVQNDAVKALCDIADCTSWYGVASTVRLSAPDSPLLPSIAISMPSYLGNCDSLTIDLTNSVGSGPSPWQSVSVEVHSMQASLSSVLQIQSFLNTRYVLSPPTSIARSLFDSPAVYSIVVRACNFLSLCGTATSKVAVIDVPSPRVVIEGSHLRSIESSSGLYLYANAGILRNCSGNASKGNLSYIWTVSSNNIVLYNIKSQSSSPSIFYLPPNSFLSSQIISVNVRVLDLESLFSVIDSVVVIVEQEPLSASIAGPSTFSLYEGVSTNLSAVSNTVNESISLRYQWSCYQIYPVLSSKCGVRLDNSTSWRHSIKVTGYKRSSVSIVQVKVSDGLSVVTDEVTIRVLPPDAFNITLSMDAIVNGLSVTKYQGWFQISTADTVKIYANSSISSPLSVSHWPNVSWHMDGIADLASLVTVPTVHYFADGTRNTPVSSGIVSLPTNMIILDNVLSEGSFYTLQLRAGETMCSMMFYTNLSPKPGLFSTTPTRGREWGTVFWFAAEFWVDEDLPLVYSFGYLGLDGVFLANKLYSELTYSSSQLACLRQNVASDSIITMVIVQDSLGATANSTSSVHLDCLTSASIVTIGMAIEDSLAGVVGDMNGLSAVIALGVGALNSVDCSKAPQCPNLNRENCRYTQNTCGQCFNGFIGFDGDANSLCFSSNTRRLSNVLLDTNSSFCTTDSNCGSWQTCVGGTCNAKSMPCPGEGNCSGSGHCRYINRYTGAFVANCSVVDLYCQSTCQCSAGYYGSSCEFNSTEWSAVVSGRHMLLTSLRNILKLVDLSSPGILSFLIQQMNGISLSGDQLRFDSFSSLYTILLSILEHGSQVSIPRHKMMLIAESMPALLIHSLNDTEYADALVLLNRFQALLASNMIMGEFPSQYLGLDLRYSVSLVSPASTLSSEWLFTLPLTSLEEYHQVYQQNLTLSSKESVWWSQSGMAVFGAEISSRLIRFNRSFAISNPIFWWFSHPGEKATVSSNFPYSSAILNIQYNQAIDLIAPFEEVHHLTCYDRDYFVQNYTCRTSGEILSIHCPGKPGVYTDRCDIYNVSTLCKALQTFSSHSLAHCKTLTYNEEHVVCACDVNFTAWNTTSYSFLSDPAATSMGRRLAVATSSEASQKLLALDFGAYQHTDIYTFGGYFTLSSDLTTEHRSYIIYASATLMLAAVLIWSTLFFYRDRFDAHLFKEKLKPVEEKMRHKPNLFAQTPSLRREASSVAFDLNEKRHPPANHSPTAWRKFLAARYEDLESVTEDSLWASLPSFYGPESIFMKVWREQCCYNRYLAVLMHRSGNYNRMFRVLEIGVRCLSAMSFLTFIYSFTNPDDGSCKKFSDERLCIAEESSLVHGQSKCYWTYSTHSCHFRQPKMDVIIVLSIATVGTVFAAVIAKLYEHFVLIKLCMPLATMHVPSQSLPSSANPFASLRKAVLRFFTSSPVYPAGSENAFGGHMIGDDSVEDTPQMLQRMTTSAAYESAVYDHHGVVDITRYQSSSFIKAIPLEIELENIQRRIQAYGDALPFLGQHAEMKKVIGKAISHCDPSHLVFSLTLCLHFPAAWGMDNDYNFLRSADGLPVPSCFEVDDRSDVLLLHSLRRVRNVAVDELQILAFSPYSSDPERASRLLYLFQRDFLASELASAILDGKLYRDLFFQEWDNYDSYLFRYGGKHLSPNVQLAVIVCFHLLFAIMMAYIYYITLNMQKRLQENWIASLIIFLGIDIVFLSPLEVLLVHVLLPSLISDDISAIHQKIVSFLDHCKLVLASGQSITIPLPSHEQYQQPVETKAGIQLNRLQTITPTPSPSKPNPHQRNQHNDPVNTPSINSAQYFFASNRVAQYFPEAAECRLILAFTTAYPPGYDLPPSWLRPLNQVLMKNHTVYQRQVDRLNLAGESLSSKQLSPTTASKRQLRQRSLLQPSTLPAHLYSKSRHYNSYVSWRLPVVLSTTLLRLFLLLPFFVQDLLVEIILSFVAGLVVYLHYWLACYSLSLLAAPTALLIVFAILVRVSFAVGSWFVSLRRRIRSLQRIAPQPVEGIDADADNAKEYEIGMREYENQLSANEISRSIFEVADPQMNNDSDIYSDSDDDEMSVVMTIPTNKVHPVMPTSDLILANNRTVDVDDDILHTMPAQNDYTSRSIGDIPTERYHYEGQNGRMNNSVYVSDDWHRRDRWEDGVVREFQDDAEDLLDVSEDDAKDDEDEAYARRNIEMLQRKQSIREKLKLNMQKVRQIHDVTRRK
eukprot:scaffold13046_cov248-Ochromonas_danica.AAC.2